MICKNCKQTVSDTATYCRFCGATLNNDVTNPNINSTNADNSNGFVLHCRCGNKLNYDDNVCPKCHRKLFISVNKSHNILKHKPCVFYTNDQYVFLILYVIFMILTFGVHPLYIFAALITISVGIIRCPNSPILRILATVTIYMFVVFLVFIFIAIYACASAISSCPG